MYLFIEIRFTILIPCHENYTKVRKKSVPYLAISRRDDRFVSMLGPNHWSLYKCAAL